jgi:hypothetical protein
VLVAAGVPGPGFAARPLLDQHQWDAYFGLYARDANVPWKTTTVRLDTYSGAPVEFAAYNVDPADVIVAGQNRTPRALDTAPLRPVVRWRFSPPSGYRFESNDVQVPLGSREGFFVIVARRGDAVQQVWLNRTHVGLVVTQRPGGLVLWGVDLHDGRALGGMAVDFLVGLRLVRQRTDRSGLIVWRGRERPTFALAQSGAGRAFVSLLPQAPAPAALVGIRLESAVARAGTRFRFVGFARRREAGVYRRANGMARIALALRGATLGSIVVPLDAAGAFAGDLAVPLAAATGEYAVLASAAGSVGGTSLHVDAASDVALDIVSACPCDPARDVPLTIAAKRAGAPAPGVAVHVVIVRSPHVLPAGGADADAGWGTTVVYDRTLETDGAGQAAVTLPSPSDGLDSTYGVRATASGAAATSRLVVPNAGVALALSPEAPSADVGAPVVFDVRGFDPSSGSPVADLAVRVQLSHGASAAAQSVTLDRHGRAKAIFRETSLGSNLALASATLDGRQALDAADVLVEPSALAGRGQAAATGVALSLDKPSYGPRDRVAVRAAAPGASGDALVLLTSSSAFAPVLAKVAHGAASATFPLAEPQGPVTVAAALVRDGAVALGAANVPVDGPGRALALELTLERNAYGASETLHATLHGGAPGAATFAVRVADGPESAPAYFEDAPAVLAGGAASTQAPALDDPEWHAYVAPLRSKASDIFAAERPRKVGNDLPTVGAAAPRTLYWSVARGKGDTLDVPVPDEPGHYVLSVLRISDDGDLGAASASFDVR